MGKRYHCEYCDKTMVATPAIVKTHNNGLMHQKLVNEHYQQFKDPEQILSEESAKKPCLRFENGACQFGGVCRYSHYTQEYLNMLREQVNERKRKNSGSIEKSFEDLYENLKKNKTEKSQKKNDTTILYDTNGVTYVLPWTYNDDLGGNLPPSLRKMEISDFVNAEINDWG